MSHDNTRTISPNTLRDYQQSRTEDAPPKGTASPNPVLGSAAGAAYAGRPSTIDSMFDDLFRRAIGFDYLPDLFNRSERSFPPYDIYKQDDNTYVVQIALAGYHPDDVQVSQTDWDLVIASRAQQSERQNEDPGYLHRGIAKRSFTLKLGLGLHTEVTDAVMKDGMLYITVQQHKQDSDKPIEVRKE